MAWAEGEVRRLLGRLAEVAWGADVRASLCHIARCRCRVCRCCAWAGVERAALSRHPVGAGRRAAVPTGVRARESDPFLYLRRVAARTQWQVVSSAVVGNADPAGEKPSATEPSLLAWFSRAFLRPETLARPCFSSYPRPCLGF